jgi:signal transduction histidine kinase
MTDDPHSAAYHSRLRALSIRLADVRETERRKLAKDLHDVVGHELGLARIKLSETLRSGDFPMSDPLKERLMDVEEHLKQAVRETRNIGYEYFPQVLDDAGLIPALEWLANEYTHRHDLQVRVLTSDDCRDVAFSPELKSRLFTAIRECLINAYKYADAENVMIRLHPMEAGRIEILIEDDGKGFDVRVLDQMDRKEGGFGLFSIREMIEHQGGRFTCESSPGQGTRIRLEIPPEHVENL